MIDPKQFLDAVLRLANVQDNKTTEIFSFHSIVIDPRVEGVDDQRNDQLAIGVMDSLGIHLSLGLISRKTRSPFLR